MHMRRAMWSGATIGSSPLAPAQYDVSVGAVPQRSTADQSSWIHSWQRMNWRVNLARLRFRPVLRYDDEAEPGRSSWRRSRQAFRFGLSALTPRKRYELGAPLARRLTRKRSPSWPHSEAPASLCGVNRKRNVVVMRVPVSARHAREPSRCRREPTCRLNLGRTTCRPFYLALHLSPA